MSSHSRRVSFGLTLLLAVLIAGAPRHVAAQTITPAAKALIEGLHSGNWQKRATAAAGLSKEPYSTPVADAVMHEVERLQRKPDHGLSDRPKKVSAEQAETYYSDLMAYVAKSNDISVIPVLIKAVNTNNEVVERLARSGEAGVPAIVAATRASADPAYTTSALLALQLMVERRALLSQSARSAIGDAVLERLHGKQASVVATEAIAVAAVVDDPRLRKRLSEIAAAKPSSDTSLSVTDSDNAARVTAAAAAALTLTPEQHIVINNFRSSDWLRRFEASRVITNMAAADRPAEMNASVIDELKRLQKSPNLGADLVPASVQDRSAGVTYYRNLLDIASDATDPSVVPVLIKAIADGDRVVRGLVRFEEGAVPALVDAIRVGARPEEAEPALVALRRIAEKRPQLTTVSRAGMIEVTLQCLKGRQQSSVVVRAIELARVLHDDGLNTRLTAIVQAQSAQGSELVLSDPDGFARIQTAAKLALVPEK